VVGISLLGRDDQYNLAESTQCLELDAARSTVAPEDANWLAISQVRASLCPKSHHAEMAHMGTRGIGITIFAEEQFGRKRRKLFLCHYAASQTWVQMHIFAPQPL
jgi:hypothetical protein